VATRSSTAYTEPGDVERPNIYVNGHGHTTKAQEVEATSLVAQSTGVKRKLGRSV
jgi:hypothetical protein